MYQIGDLIIYGNMGVCRVMDVAVPSFCKGGEKKSYYLLEPLGQQGEIYIPVDSKVFMRPVIHREEANRLIDLIPSMQAQAFHSTAMQELTQHYSAALNTHDCQDLIQLIMSIYAKKKYRQQRNQKFGTVDENYMKRAEELLNTEFSVALGIPPSEVPAYIAARVKAAQKRAGKA
jgi:CarD family transcriptional regulator